MPLPPRERRLAGRSTTLRSKEDVRDILRQLKQAASNIESEVKFLAGYGYQRPEEQDGFPVSGRCHIALACRDIPGRAPGRSRQCSLPSVQLLRQSLRLTTRKLTSQRAASHDECCTAVDTTYSSTLRTVLGESVA